MATTVTSDTLSVTIQESVSLNGVTYGNSINQPFSAQGLVDQRIMSIAASGDNTFTTILALSTVDSKGTVVVANFGYFRITNLDDTNKIILQLYVNATNCSYHQVEAGESFILMSPDMDVSVIDAAPSLADITQINADADDGAVDIEYVAVMAA